jgi:hypothetical protein
VLAGGGVACGISTQDHPEPINPTEVPAAPTPTVTVVPNGPNRVRPELTPHPTSTPGDPSTPTTPPPAPASASTGIVTPP